MAMAADDAVQALAEQHVEVSFAEWPSPVAAVAAVAPAAGRWVEREAAEAAIIVAGFVGVPAAIAAGAVLVLFVLNVVVLLAPVIAIALTWVAWRANRRSPSEPA